MVQILKLLFTKQLEKSEENPNINKVFYIKYSTISATHVIQPGTWEKAAQ